MKKFNYLLSLLFLQNGSLRKRWSIMKEMDAALEQRLQKGETMNEAIHSVGTLSEVLNEYDNGIDEPTNKFKLFSYYLICILMPVFIVMEILRGGNGTYTMHYSMDNSIVFVASKYNIAFLYIIIFAEVIVFLYFLKKILRHYVCRQKVNIER